MVRLEAYILLRSFKAEVVLKDANYPPDKTGYSDKQSVLNMAFELVRDIRQQMHQTDGMRNELGTSLIFEIGTILGQIREKYRRQVDMYRQAYNKYHNLSHILSPEDVGGLRGLHYVIIMEFVMTKQLEIEQLVEILLRVPLDELYQNTQPPFKIPLGANAPKLRAGESVEEEPIPEEAEQEISRLAKEEALKQRYRAEYMKRHGNKI